MQRATFLAGRIVCRVEIVLGIQASYLHDDFSPPPPPNVDRLLIVLFV